jgi:peptidyl-prolyl cis-trans isomerase C
MTMPRIKTIFLSLLFAIIQTELVHAQDQSRNNSNSKQELKQDTRTDFEFVATVNGQPITQGLVNLNLRAAIAQGQRDTPELRQAIKEELINKELAAQEAERLGLAKEIDFPDQIAQLKQNLLLQALIEDRFKREPITDAQLRQEYDRQRKLIGDGKNNFQYRLSQILVTNETDALDLIRRIQKGELFGKLAQEFSIDSGSKQQGGSLGWIFPNQVIPEIGNILPGLKQGAITTTPIKTPTGWVIVKLDDKRQFKVPEFEESKPQLRQALIQQFFNGLVQNLRINAKIVQ